ncbi:MAG: ATP-binding protein [Actinomycetota bacterium]|nr:ATP-binding protein [Actinomycetota bacterium]
MDKVTLRIPAEPAYVQVIRLIAAGLASRLKLTLEDIDDLRIAVDELATYLVGRHGREGTLEVHFVLHADRIEIQGRGDFPAGEKVRTDLTELSRMILETVADSASLEAIDGAPGFALTKKRPSGSPSGVGLS